MKTTLCQTTHALTEASERSSRASWAARHLRYDRRLLTILYRAILSTRSSVGMGPILNSKSWRNGNLGSALKTTALLCLTVFISFLSAKVADSLVVRPYMVWPLWPGCALLVGLLLLVPQKTWPVLIPAGIGGFVLYDLQTGLTLRSTALLV